MLASFRIKLLIITSCCLLQLLLYAQPLSGKISINSLINLLPVLKQDSNKINTLNILSYNYRNVNPDSGIFYGSQSIILAQKINWQQGLAEAYNCVGNNYFSLSDSFNSIKNYKLAFAVYKQLNNKAGCAWSINFTGNIYQYLLSDYVTAMPYYEQAFSLFQQSKNKTGEAASCENIAIGYESLGDYTKALQKFQQAEVIDEELKDVDALALNYGHMGIFYSDMEQNDKALDYCKKSLVIFQQTGNKKGIAHNLSTIGSIYLDLHKNNEAIDYFKQSINISKQINDVAGMAKNIGNMGIAYTEMKNYNEALKCQQQSYEMNKKSGDQNGMASALANMGDIYFRNTNSSSNNYNNALKNYSEALVTAKEIDALDLQEYCLQAISNVYEKQHNYEDAFKTYKNYISIRDSILDDEKRREITQREIQFTYNQKEQTLKAEQDKKNVLASSEIKKQTLIKNYTLGGVAMASIFAGLLIVSFNRRRKTKFDNQVMNVEMKALRSQMNPHFIFNSLHSINNYILENEKENASAYLSKFANLMRLILENSREQEVPLETDLHTLELYMQLEALRFSNKFSYSIKTDENIDKENTLIPPMLLQPFVENAILHGIKNKQDGEIKIKVHKEDEMIRYTIEDNGKEITSVSTSTADESKKHKSLGKKIIDERLQIINRLKKAKASVNIINLKDAENKPCGMRVELLLPLELAV